MGRLAPVSPAVGAIPAAEAECAPAVAPWSERWPGMLPDEARPEVIKGLFEATVACVWGASGIVDGPARLAPTVVAAGPTCKTHRLTLLQNSAHT